MSETFNADFFDGRSARRHAVRVEVDGTTVAIRGDDVSLDVARAEARVRPRIGSTPVRIALPGDGLLVARDFAAVDAALGVPRARTLAHRLESHVGMVVVALVVLAVGGFFAYRDGIPWAAQKLVNRIPVEAEAQMSRDALASADAFLFKPSQLTRERESALRREFARLAATAGVPRARLEFRDSNVLDINAFTLPGDTIVVTDKLANLMPDRQVVAILAHELGHVHHRHGLRLLLAHSMHALAVMAVFGDATGAAAAVATLPTILVNNGYSRDFEREADAYAFALLKRHGRSPLDFASALRELQNLSRGSEAHPGPRFSYLSTHPDTEERIMTATEAARRR